MEWAWRMNCVSRVCVCTSSAVWFIFHFRRGSQPQRNWLTWQRKYITFLVCVTLCVCVCARECVRVRVSLRGRRSWCLCWLINTIWLSMCLMWLSDVFFVYQALLLQNQPGLMVRRCAWERARLGVVLVRGLCVIILIKRGYEAKPHLI